MVNIVDDLTKIVCNRFIKEIQETSKEISIKYFNESINAIANLVNTRTLLCFYEECRNTRQSEENQLEAQERLTVLENKFRELSKVISDLERTKSVNPRYPKEILFDEGLWSYLYVLSRSIESLID